MRYIVGAAILAAVVAFAIGTGRLPRIATASHNDADDTANVLKLGETVDMKALPRQEIPDEVYR
jgi:hypothetical protein